MNHAVQGYLDRLEGSTKQQAQQVYDYIMTKYPSIKDGVSYGVIMFENGKQRFHLGGFTKHIGLYPGVAFIEQYKEQYPDYKTSKGTIQIQNKQDIPFDLIDSMVQDVLKLTK